MSEGVSGAGIFRTGRLESQNSRRARMAIPMTIRKFRRPPLKEFAKRGDKHRSHGGAGGEQEEQVPIDGLAAYGAFGMSDGHRD